MTTVQLTVDGVDGDQDTMGKEKKKDTMESRHECKRQGSLLM